MQGGGVHQVPFGRSQDGPVRPGPGPACVRNPDRPARPVLRTYHRTRQTTARNRQAGECRRSRRSSSRIRRARARVQRARASLRYIFQMAAELDCPPPLRTRVHWASLATVTPLASLATVTPLACTVTLVAGTLLAVTVRYWQARPLPGPWQSHQCRSATPLAAGAPVGAFAPAHLRPSLSLPTRRLPYPFPQKPPPVPGAGMVP